MLRMTIPPNRCVRGAALCLSGLALALVAACGDGGGSAVQDVGTELDAAVGADTPADQDGSDLTAADLAPDLAPDGASDAVAELPDTGPELPGESRRFVQEKTGLGADFVYKGVWAGEAGRVVAVGNDGVIVSRSSSGAWSRLSQGEGSQLLNAVTGPDGDNLWAVGKDGTILRGSAGGFGVGGGCLVAADCDDGDPCTDSACEDGLCVVTSSEAAGCCGTKLGSWRFDGGTAEGFTQIAQTGTLKWQPVSHTDPITSAPRFTSAPYALYFGDPSKPFPDFDTGEVVAATIATPTVLLPKTGRASVRFQVFVDVEPSANFHLLTLEVSSGQSVQQVWSKAKLAQVPTNGFVPVEVDLTPWIGKAVSLRFRFDSVVSSFNFGEGVYIDDIVIDSSCAASVDLELPTLFGAAALAVDDVWAVGLAGAIAHFDGVSWREVGAGALPTSWNAMHGAGGRIALVGSSGAIAVSEGSGLLPVDSPTAFTLRGVHSVDGDTFWAVGDNGTMLRGQGDAWNLVSLPTAKNLWAVVVLAPTDAYAVGDGGTILHYNGTLWSLVTALPASMVGRNLRGVTAAGPGQVLVTGATGAMLLGSADAGFMGVQGFDGVGEIAAAWSQGGVSVVVGENSSIFRDSGQGWVFQKPPSTQHLRAVWGTAPDDIWAVGLAGLILHWDGVGWKKIPSPVGIGLETVWGVSSNDVYSAGQNGSIIHWDGTAWSIAASQTTEHLRGVFGSADTDVWAVGGGGVIMRQAGLAWAAVSIAPLELRDGSTRLVVDTLHAVWGIASDDVWAVGANGQIVHWDGETWSSRDPQFGITLRGVYGLSADDVWAVGNEGHVLHWDGQAWTPWETGSVATLYAIHGDGQGQVYAVGDLGTVLRLDASE
ncbi:MAG: hypothetical protein R3F39_02375 [Myxococcota bacterium]